MIPLALRHPMLHNTAVCKPNSLASVMVPQHDVLACQAEAASKLVHVHKLAHTQHSRQRVSLVGRVGKTTRVVLQHINLEQHKHSSWKFRGRKQWFVVKLACKDCCNPCQLRRFVQMSSLEYTVTCSREPNKAQ